MSLWILLPITFGVSLLLTWIIRRYALARSMMDIPNNRSSHSLPTPRGGGWLLLWLILPCCWLLGGWSG